MDEKLLTLEQLKISLDTQQGVVRAVDGASFSVHRGETFALLGESGCGKSMIALSILQLLPPNARSQGHLRFLEHNLLQMPEVALRRIRGRKLSMIFQEPMTALNPIIRVGEQIAEVLHQHSSIKRHERKARVNELLTQVGISDAQMRSQQFPHQLSGGMKQRIMIAMALAARPDLLIADEPTTALDVTIQAQILKLLKAIQIESNMGMLLITHDLGVVRQTADRIGVMYAGHLVEEADVESFFAKPLHPYSQQLFAALPNLEKREQSLTVIKGQVPDLKHQLPACRFAERCPYAWDICHTRSPKWLSIASHGAVRCHLYDDEVKQTAPANKAEAPEAQSRPFKESNEPLALLFAHDLKVHFPIQKGLFKRTVATVKAVDGIDLTLKKGQTLALVGESGCGKTTVGRALLRLLDITAGEVLYQHQNLANLTARQLKQFRSDVQIIFQDPFSAMNPRMMVGDVIAEGMLASSTYTKAERKRRVQHLLEQVGLPIESIERYPHEFSGGQRQRICIARALAVDPRIIICDEPTSALDVSVQAQILNLLKQLQQRHGLSYLFISHDISVVAYLAQEIAVMYLGRIVERGSAQEILNHPKHPYTQALLVAVPKVDGNGTPPKSLPGEQPSPLKPPQGCHFHPRCPKGTTRCQKNYPKMTSISNSHSVRCFLYE